jgi:hypothetical protein
MRWCFLDRENCLKKIAKIQGKEEYDFLDEFALDYGEKIIKNYCGIDEIPFEIEETYIDIAIEILNIYSEKGVTSENIKQIQEGDISVSFKDNIENMFSIRNFKEQLASFRRLKW